jgi:hypothetical protein
VNLDLVVLVADKNMRFALEGLLTRHQSLKIHSIAAQVLIHPRHDSGALLECHEFLRLWQRRASYALVVFDRDDRPDPPLRGELEDIVEKRLAESGWRDRSAAVVIDPELEAWLWSDSPHVAAALRWSAANVPNTSLEQWLVQAGHLEVNQRKPRRPKEAVEAVLELSKTPPSSSIFREIAERVSFQRCTDPAFLKLRSVLARWFPEQG